ncbi:hypothetical protein D3C76_1708710 [compost metagenome]
MIGGSLVIRGALGAVEVVDAVEQDVELGNAFDRREIMRSLAGKGAQAHRIALAQRHVTQ